MIADTARSLATRRGARQESLREHNLTLVLGAVRAAATPPSRAALAAATGLTRPTVSDLVDRLLAAGLVAELPVAAPRGAGRPAVPLRIADGFVGYGLEINVNRVGVSAVTLAGDVLAEEQRGLTNRGRAIDDVVADLVELARPIIARTRAERRCVGIGVSVPGMMSQPRSEADPTVLLAPNLGWRDVDVLGALRRARPFGRSWPAQATVALGNDADLGARAELALAGAGSSFVYLSGEVGLGGAIVVDGQRLPGQRGWAGELGHVCVEPDGRRCPCGARGCLETYVGTRALVRDAGVTTRRVADRVPSLLRDLAAGKPRATEALEVAGQRLGVALAGVINVIDVDELVLGGPLGLLADWLATPLARELTRRVITSAWRPLGVRAAAAGTLGAARGAALGVLDKVFAAPSRWF